MDILQKFISEFGWEEIILTCFKILMILIAGWLATLVIRNILSRLEKRLLEGQIAEGEPPSETAKRVETIIKLIRQAIRLALWVVVGLIILREMGIDIGPILASVGVLGLAVGFGAQNLVRDFLSGFFFILENQVRIGDVAIINGTGGLVEQINFRTIVLRDLGGVVHIFPNGQVNTLSNLTREWSAYVFEIGVAYKENTDRVIDILRQTGNDMKEDAYFGSRMLAEPEIFGVDKFGDSAVVIKGRIKTKPILQWEVGRQFLRRVKLAFDEQGIEIPFPHRTIYFGEESKPIDVKFAEKLAKDL